MATIIGRALILGSSTPPGPTPVSDLTGTVWLFNDSTPVNPSGYNSYSITFSFINAITSETVTATSIGFSGSGNVIFGYVYMSSTDEYEFGYFTDSYAPFGDVNNWGYSNGLSVTKTPLSRVIKITGGTDATNTDLIDWIQENAIQIPADLSGTTWVWNDAVNLIDTLVFSINFISNSTSYSVLSRTYWWSTEPIPMGEAYISYGNNQVAYGDPSQSASATSWYNNAYKTINIIDGTDVTNLYLIAWICANATQVTT